MGGCSVEGCKNRVSKGGKHFYRFPKDYRSDIWAKFTRKGPDFKPKQSCTICEIHFDEQSFVEKKTKMCISKDAVPTIFYLETDIGIEKIEVPFNFETREYQMEVDLDKMRGALSSEDKEMIAKKRQHKLLELKTLCRFCFDSKTETRCIKLSNLEPYKIDPAEMMKFYCIATGAPFNEIFSELICEVCFNHFVAIRDHKNRCKAAQNEILAEINEIDTEIEAIPKMKSEKMWLKSEIFDLPEIEMLDDEEVSDEDFEYQFADSHQEVYEEEVENYKMEIHEDIEIVDQELIYKDPSESKIIINVIEDVELSKKARVPFEQFGYDTYTGSSSDVIIKNLERNRFAFRIYECFFCKVKFAGKKTYKAHKCEVKEVKCPQCDKTFDKLKAYNCHLRTLHKTVSISKHFCPVCKTVIMTTISQFKAHRKKCNREKGDTKPVECEVCHKICSSLKGYSIHKLFHETRNTIGIVNNRRPEDKEDVDGLNMSRAPAICEICGNTFTRIHGLTMHMKTVHKETDENFQCDLCGRVYKTKQAISKHVRNIHRSNHVPCPVCGKIFRTKELLQKHSKYHDETKRSFMCQYCPDKPGWYTNVALKRHQRSHFGERPYACEICASTFTTNHQLKLHRQNHHSVY